MDETLDNKFVTVNNLETYHAGYKDRTLIWCKTYFTMINADPEFELMHEIDKWRLIAFIMLELQIKKPVPLNPKYLERKGFDLESRPISLTLQMLHNFVTTVTEDSKVCSVEKRRVEKKRVYKSQDKKSEKHFNILWELYPRKDGRKSALKSYNVSVKTDQDKTNIQKALENYKKSINGTDTKFIKMGSTWFNNWQDYINWTEPQQDIGVIF